MIITKELFDTIEYGEVFRITTTKYQRMHEPGKAQLTFICEKGDGDDWAIYCGHAGNGADWLLKHGDKVQSEDIIRSICPCDDEVFKLYRR